MHFGESPALFALFTIDTCLRIFGGSPAELPLYQDIFGITTRDLSADNLRMIDDLLRLLQAKKNDDAHQHVLEIGICLMNYFAKVKHHCYIDNVSQIYSLFFFRTKTARNTTPSIGRPFSSAFDVASPNPTRPTKRMRRSSLAQSPASL